MRAGTTSSSTGYRVSSTANTRASDMQIASHTWLLQRSRRQDTHQPTSCLSPLGKWPRVWSEPSRRIPNMITWRSSRTICQATLFQTLALVAHEHTNGHKPRSLRTRVTSSPSTPRFLLLSDCRLYPAKPSNHQDNFPTPPYSLHRVPVSRPGPCRRMGSSQQSFVFLPIRWFPRAMPVRSRHTNRTVHTQRPFPVGDPLCTLGHH
ncbi:hypothetical protein B0H65DRAFT_132259 [Neurospora tetraspora]|uniref:Uncharacterized protein n=1 Tax=Neurospora tetraspora TaxID=94610 RepID=A0AAE0JL42_9PEZI|nr:hypothetical protein B0H65DRAFT_132259 [Neurospora tetraspora]